MRADNVHGTIGKKMRKAPEIPTFQDFVDLCDKTSKHTKPVVMHQNDFYLFQDGHRTRQTKKVVLPILGSIVEVQFRKGSRLLFYKQSFDDSYTEVEFLKPTFNIHTFPEVMTEPRGISSAKKEKLVKLAGCFDPPKRKFWAEMPVNDASHDLVAEFQ